MRSFLRVPETVTEPCSHGCRGKHRQAQIRIEPFTDRAGVGLRLQGAGTTFVARRDRAKRD